MNLLAVRLVAAAALLITGAWASWLLPLCAYEVSRVKLWEQKSGERQGVSPPSVL